MPAAPPPNFRSRSLPFVPSIPFAAGNHVQHVMEKINVDSRTAATVFAVRHGLG
jgi:hypothetical protein